MTGTDCSPAGGKANPTPLKPLSEVRGKIDCGIISIRPDEFEAVCKFMPATGLTVGSRWYSLSHVDVPGGGECHVAIMRCPEQGGGAAQDAARDFIEDLRPGWLLVVGIAGGRPSDEFTLGDVVVSTRVHDFSVEAVLENGDREYNVTAGPLDRRAERHTDLTDKTLGFGKGRKVRIHFPIQTNPKVEFTSWNLDDQPTIVNMKVGQCWYAAELARVSVWIGEIQWMLRNGFSVSRDPILKPLNNIECRDAILNEDGTEATWPFANVVIGNPPFLGDRQHRIRLGENYTAQMRQTYSVRVPGRADLVTYWVQKATEKLIANEIGAFGLVATKSIAKGASRAPLDKLTATGEQLLFNCWTNEPWIVEGAAVRVSVICAVAPNFRATVKDIFLNGELVDSINPDLTTGIDVTKAKRQPENLRIAFQGVKLCASILGFLEWIEFHRSCQFPNGDHWIFPATP